MKRTYPKHRTRIHKLLVYGGSFDPVHFGHILGIKTVLKALNPSLCFLIPAFRNPFKITIKYSARQRIKWLKRGLKLHIKDKRAHLCLFEIKRNSPVPTIFTIRFLRKKFNIKELYFLLGADNAEHLHTWDAFDELKDLTQFIFLEREHYVLPLDSYRVVPFHHPASSTQIRRGEQREFLPKFCKA